jgi:predicted AAA+ superfamily ATPase
MNDESALIAHIDRLAAALERLAQPAPAAPDFEAAEAFVWHADRQTFEPVANVNRVPLALLKALDHVAPQLAANTERFARRLPANNALLWGARGMGKSSLVKAVHADVRRRLGKELKARGSDLKLVEIHREDIASLPHCLAAMRSSEHRFIVFCDDLSFDKDDTSYKSLKAVLEGGIEGRPENVIFYATSNRRHLMPEYFSENLETKHVGEEVHPGESVEEKISLSERFGLWISFYPFSQDDYLAAVASWLDAFGVPAPRTKRDETERHRDALQFALQRGSRSGRIAWQFARGYAGAAALRRKSGA